jgi:hypothetical protein
LSIGDDSALFFNKNRPTRQGADNSYLVRRPIYNLQSTINNVSETQQRLLP